MVAVGTTHLCMLHVRAPQAAASVPLSLLFGARSGVVAGFYLHTIRAKALAQVVESLLQKGAIELAPFSLLGYYSRFVYHHEGLGVVAASNRYSRYVILKDVYLQVPMHPESR